MVEVELAADVGVGVREQDLARALGYREEDVGVPAVVLVEDLERARAGDRGQPRGLADEEVLLAIAVEVAGGRLQRPDVQHAFLQVVDRVAPHRDRGGRRGHDRGAGGVAGLAVEHEHRAVARQILRPGVPALARTAHREIVVAVAVQVAQRGARAADGEVLQRERGFAAREAEAGRRHRAEAVRAVERRLAEHQVRAADVRELAGERVGAAAPAAAATEADEAGIDQQHVVKAVAVHVPGDDGVVPRAVLRVRRRRVLARAEQRRGDLLERAGILRRRIGPQRRAHDRGADRDGVLRAPRRLAVDHVADCRAAGRGERRRGGNEDVGEPVVVPVEHRERAVALEQLRLEQHRVGGIRIDHLPQAVLVLLRQQTVDPGARDVPRDLDPVRIAAEEQRENGRVAVVARADEDEIGQAVAADVAHPLRRPADLAVDDVVGAIADPGDRVELDRAEEHVRRVAAVDEKIRDPVAVEVGELDRICQRLAVRLARERERVPDLGLALDGNVDPRHRLRPEPGRLRRRKREEEELGRQRGCGRGKRLGDRAERLARVEPQRVAAATGERKQRALDVIAALEVAERAEEQRLRLRGRRRGREARAARLEHQVGNLERARQVLARIAQVDVQDLPVELGELAQPLGLLERGGGEIGLAVAVEVADRAEIEPRQRDRVGRVQRDRDRDAATPRQLAAAEDEPVPGVGGDQDVRRAVAVDVSGRPEIERAEVPLDDRGELRPGAVVRPGVEQQLVERVAVAVVGARDAEVLDAVQVDVAERHHVAQAARGEAGVGEGGRGIAQPVDARAAGEELDVVAAAHQQVRALATGGRALVGALEHRLVDHDEIVDPVTRHVPEERGRGPARPVEVLPAQVVVARGERLRPVHEVERVEAVVVDDQLIVDVEAGSVVAPGAELVLARGRDEDLPAPARGEIRLQVAEGVEARARAAELDEEVVDRVVVAAHVRRTEPLDRLDGRRARQLARRATVEVGAEDEFRPGRRVDPHAQVVDRPGLGRARVVAHAVPEEAHDQRAGGVRDRLERRLAREVVERVDGRAEPAVLADDELRARRRHVALRRAGVAERVGEDAHPVDGDVEPVRAGVAAPPPEDGEEELEVDGVVRRQPFEREPRLAGRLVAQELPIHEAGNPVERSRVGVVEVLDAQAPAVERGDIARPGDGDRLHVAVGQEQVAVGPQVEHVARVPEQHVRRHDLLGRRPGRVPRQRHRRGAGVLEHLEADVVEAGGERHRTRLLGVRVQPVVVHDQLVVDVQARSVVRPDVEGVGASGRDPDLARPAGAEVVVQLGEAGEAGADRRREVHLRVDAGVPRGDRIEVDVIEARREEEVLERQEAEVLAEQARVGGGVVLPPVGTSEQDVDALVLGNRRDEELVRQDLRDGDRDVVEAVAVDVADALDLGLVAGEPGEDRRRQRERERRVDERRVEAAGGAECDPGERLALAAAGQDVVADRDDRIVEAVAVDVAERDERRRTEQLTRRIGRRRFLGRHVHRIAERGQELDAVLADAERLGEQNALVALVADVALVAARRIVVVESVLQRAVVLVRGQVHHLVAADLGHQVAGLLESPVPRESLLATAQHAVEVRLDVLGGARGRPDPDLVNAAFPVLQRREGLPAADPELVVAGVGVADVAGPVVGVDELPVRVGLDEPAVVDHRDVGPLSFRERVAGVDPGPARVRVGERPPQRAAEPGDLVFAFLVDDDAAVCTVRPQRARAHPRFDRQLVGGLERRAGCNLHVVGELAEDRVHLAVERQRAVPLRGVRLDLVRDVQQVEVGHAREALARHQRDARRPDRCLPPGTGTHAGSWSGPRRYRSRRR